MNHPSSCSIRLITSNWIITPNLWYLSITVQTLVQQPTILVKIKAISSYITTTYRPLWISSKSMAPMAAGINNKINNSSIISPYSWQVSLTCHHFCQGVIWINWPRLDRELVVVAVSVEVAALIWVEQIPNNWILERYNSYHREVTTAGIAEVVWADNGLRIDPRNQEY